LSGTKPDPKLKEKYIWLEMPNECFDVSYQIFVKDGREYEGGDDTIICPK